MELDNISSNKQKFDQIKADELEKLGIIWRVAKSYLKRNGERERTACIQALISFRDLVWSAIVFEVLS